MWASPALACVVLGLGVITCCAFGPPPLPPPAAFAALHFRISVVDGATGRGVPLAILRTGSYISHYTDSAGNVAFFELGLMDQPVFFEVLSDGYNLSSAAANPSAEFYGSPYDSGVSLLAPPLHHGL